MWTSSVISQKLGQRHTKRTFEFDQAMARLSASFYTMVYALVDWLGRLTADLGGIHETQPSTFFVVLSSGISS